MKRRIVGIVAISALVLAGLGTGIVLEQVLDDSEQIPSSFVPPEVPAARKYKEIVRAAIRDGDTLSSLYSLRSTSEKIVDRLAIKPGEVVADIGCGTGGLELALLERKVPFKTLYALDIDGAALEFLSWILQASKLEGRERIKVIKSQHRDTTLKPNSVDLAILLNTPIYTPEMGEARLSEAARSCLASIHAALKPGGRLEVFDDNTGHLPAPGEPICQRIIKILEQHGFRARRWEDLLLYDDPEDQHHCHVELVRAN